MMKTSSAQYFMSVFLCACILFPFLTTYRPDSNLLQLLKNSVVLKGLRNGKSGNENTDFGKANLWP